MNKETAEELYLKFLGHEKAARDMKRTEEEKVEKIRAATKEVLLRKKADSEIGSEQGGQPHGSDEKPKRKRPSAKPIIDFLTKGIDEEILSKLPPTGTAECSTYIINNLAKKIGEVLGVKVEVSGNINITFKLG